ncbi:SusC/RagA family TonB-linked outer membrane protein [Aestuariibaculum suncheonense]|uniref:SusC/RagA family TonB-linked outer membrane protein n=1 Tax=Aestuariibaculum suncheonense TaxID=1028745 RepID=A0A8J6QC32_9FLAO|nr:SusC/RagA family TonB-linked outer membrane protein [Aestuariibaculum suncheonense]MBD0834312.1 SusC/RagA family TonB-linked outer membrane protein [Aestuariibaculum suncheonense]
MKTKFSGILALLLVLIVQLTYAQEKTISGTVSDETGLPLPGTTVLVKGTSSGVSSDFDGNYSIKASQGATLVFSFVGYTTQEVIVGTSNTVNVTMLEDAAKLEEVVIVGYGTSTKQSFAGTAQTVKSENLEIKNVSNVSQALAGEVAGVTVINTSGQPGTTSTIRIRGYGSVNGNRDPLYVVDGVPYNGGLNSINPADIKSTTVLKDATATAIYGSRGANGVILITTKTGSANDSYIELDVKSGINTQIIPRYDVIKSPEEYIGYVWEGIYNRGDITGSADPVAYANSRLFTNNYVAPGYNMWNVANGGELIDPATHMVRDGVTRKYTPRLYADEAFDSAFRNEGSLRMGGGNDKSKYFFSLGFLNDDGYAKNTSYDRYTSRLNLTSDVKEWLEVGANMGYSYSESLNNGQTVGSENVFEFADKMAPIFPVYLRDDNGNLVPDPIFGGNQFDYGTVSGFRDRPNANNLNPIASSIYDYVGFKRHDFNGNVNMNIKFTDHLTLETRYGTQYSMERYKNYSNPFYGTATGDGGNLFTRDRERLSSNFLQLLRYKNDFGNHSLEVLAAHENNEYTFRESTQYKGKVVLDGLLELDNFISNLSPPTGFNEGATIESYFGQVNYDYNDKYYLTGSIRRDGSSRFVNDKWGTFGSVGAAWVISNEDFLDSNLFTFLKLKASYGITGDQAGVDYYSGYDTFNSGILGGEISISAADNGNPDLTWETSKMFQTGVEFTLGTFLDGSIDYYNKLTDNLIFERRVGPSQGIAIITVNDGELKNQGIEFDFTGHIFNKNNFKLDVGVNGEIIKNEIAMMPIEPSTGLPRILDTSPGDYAYSKGSSIYDFYLREWAGVDPADGAPMWYQYFNDSNDNGILDSGEESITTLTPYLSENPDANIAKRVTRTYSQATDKYVGKSGIPDVRGAFRIGGELGNFNFSTQFTYSIGGYAIDYQYGELMSDRFGAVGNNYHRDIAGRWTMPGDITNIPRLADGIDQNSTSTSTRFLTKTDYLALNNAMIGYTLPSKFLENTPISYVNLWASGDNLFIKTARDGFNPTVTEDGSSTRRIYAPLTTFTLGVRVKF